MIFTSIVYSIKTWKKLAQISQLFHPYHYRKAYRKQFQCRQIVLNNKTGPLFLECNWSMRTHELAFLENSKSRDNWQYTRVVRLPITLYKGVLTFGVFLTKSFKRRLFASFPMAIWSWLLCCAKSFLVLNISYQKCDHSSEKYRAELSWCKNFNFAVLWCKKKYQQIFWIADTEKKIEIHVAGNFH